MLAFSLLLIAYGSVIVNERLAVARLKNVSPVVSKTLPAVVFSAGDSSFVFRPYDNETAGKLVELLPKTLVMTRWGDGAYSASLSGKADVSGNETSHRRAFFKGDVVFAVGKSIFNRTSKMNIGEFLLQYGGGGHITAGTCQVPVSDADKVREEIIAAMVQDI